MKSYDFDGHKLTFHMDRVCTFMQTGDCFPLYMEISLTGNCNHRCIFCAYDFIGHPNRRLETKALLRFVDQIADCGVKSILLAGEGEPLLHADVAPVIEHARSAGIDVGVFTNAQMLNQKLAERILPHLTFLRVSFNGGDERSYCQVHGVKPDVFAKVLGNIRQSARIKHDYGLQLDIGSQFVIIPENAAFVIEAAKMLKDCGMDYFVVKPFIHQNEEQQYRLEKSFNSDFLKGNIITELEQLNDDHFFVMLRRDAFKKPDQRTYRHCYGTSFISVLDSRGNIASCLPYWHMDLYTFGNIYSQDFKQIWQGEKRRQIKENLERSIDPAKCPQSCRPNAINAFLYNIKHPSVKHINFI